MRMMELGRAESRKILPVIVALVVLFGIFIWVRPYWTAYTIRLAALTTCREISSRAAVGEQPNDGDWARTFRAAAGAEGVRLADDQYVFVVTDNPTGRICKAKIHYESINDWSILSEVLDLPTYKTRHVVKVDYQYRKSY